MFDVLSAGTALEYFDLVSFFLVSNYIPFIQHSATLQFVLSQTGRLIGATLISMMSYKIDQHNILIYSILVMSLATLGMGILPDSANSFYLLAVLRALQGLAIAVEFPTGASVATERRRTFLVVNGATKGYILASLLCSILFHQLSSDCLRAFCWRIPFLIGGSFGLILLYLRLDRQNQNKESNSYWDLVLIITAASFAIYSLCQVWGVLKSASYILPATEFSTKYLLLPIIVGILFQTRILDYSCLVFYAVLASSTQAWLVSNLKQLAPIHTLALLVSILVGYTTETYIGNYSLSNIIFYTLSTLCAISYVFPVRLLHWHQNGFGLIYIFCITQIILTISMIKSFKLLSSSRIPKKATPPIYNLFAFLSTLALSFIIKSVPIYSIWKTSPTANPLIIWKMLLLQIYFILGTYIISKITSALISFWKIRIRN